MIIDTTQLALQRAMEGASMRQEALASNLANANTPGYQRKDVDFKSALAGALGSGDAARAVESARITTSTDSGVVNQANGNGVDIDAESAKLAANGLEYEQFATAAKTRIQILKIAMGAA